MLETCRHLPTQPVVSLASPLGKLPSQGDGRGSDAPLERRGEEGHTCRIPLGLLCRLCEVSSWPEAAAQPVGKARDCPSSPGGQVHLSPWATSVAVGFRGQPRHPSGSGRAAPPWFLGPPQGPKGRGLEEQGRRDGLGPSRGSEEP